MMFRDLLIEATLSRSELYHRGDAKHLRTLVTMAKSNHPFELSAKAQEKYNSKTAVVDKSEIKKMEPFLSNIESIKTDFPDQLLMIVNGKKVNVKLTDIEKTKLFTGIDSATKEAFNTGHIAELCMGLSVATKFINFGKPITVNDVIATVNLAATRRDDKNYLFQVEQSLVYPEKKSKTDTLKFLARVPGVSAEAFLDMVRKKQFADKVQAVLASAVAYVNESAGVANSILQVRTDPNNNKIDIVSDGTTDAKGTKADLILSVDGKKVNLLSLKTYSTDTLGQISGITYENLNKWFLTSFGFNFAPYKDQFKFDRLVTNDKAKRKTAADDIYKKLLTFYDKTVMPFVVQKIEKQTPNKEAAIVKQLANAALYHSRGDKLEDVEIVKLDDKISRGGYKVLKFSNDLEQAMQRLDLKVRYLNQGESRTIQIFAVDAADDNIDVKPIKLCQFRTTKMGGYPRNYFEIGPMLEQLTLIGKSSSVSSDTKTNPVKQTSIRKLK